MATKTAVFVHGAWMAPTSWDNFKTAFEAAGYRALTPVWPYLDEPPEVLRRNIDPAFGRLTLGEIADHYQAIIGDLPEAPLLVGHSFGGLIVQMLLDRGVGAAAVALDPGPIAGVIADPVSLGAALPVVLRWNGWNTPYTLPLKGFGDRFANTLPKHQLGELYDRFIVPAPGRIFYQAALMSGSRIDPARRTAPLLITGASEDRTVAPPLAKGAYTIQKRSPARTDFVMFPGRSHFLYFEPGWEEVAAKAIGWAKEVGA